MNVIVEVDQKCRESFRNFILSFAQGDNVKAEMGRLCLKATLMHLKNHAGVIAEAVRDEHLIPPLYRWKFHANWLMEYCVRDGTRLLILPQRRITVMRLIEDSLL